MNKLNVKRLLVTLLICTFLSGCASTNQNNETGEFSTETEHIIDMETLRSYIRTEELTVDNWEEYFEVVEVEQEPATDVFGETIENGSKYISLCVHAKDFVYGVEDDVAMRFSLSYTKKSGDYNLETEEYVDLSQYDDNKEIDVRLLVESLTDTDYGIISILSQNEPNEDNIGFREETSVTQCKLEKIQGTVGVTDIPEETLNIDEDGEQYIAVKFGKKVDRLWMDHYESTHKSQSGSDYNWYKIISLYLENVVNNQKKD